MHPIAFYRKVKGLTQAELGELVRVAGTTVRRWESGAEPRPRHLRSLAEALGVDPAVLLREIEVWKAGENRGEVAA